MILRRRSSSSNRRSQALTRTCLITTDRRAYYLRLLSKPEDYVARVAFAYPNEESNSSKWQEQIAKQKQAEQKNTIAKLPTNSVESLCFDYRVKGKDDALKPVRVFDDGQKTFFRSAVKLGLVKRRFLVVLGRDGSGDGQLPRQGRHVHR